MARVGARNEGQQHGPTAPRSRTSQGQGAGLGDEQRIPQPTGSSCYLIGFTPTAERAKIISIAKRDGAWQNQFC